MAPSLMFLEKSVLILQFIFPPFYVMFYTYSSGKNIDIINAILNIS